MRAKDLSGGSLKALLLLLLAANIVAALPNDYAWPRTPGSARASRAALGASPSARITSSTQEQGKFPAEAPETAREARALPGQPPS